MDLTQGQTSWSSRKVQSGRWAVPGRLCPDAQCWIPLDEDVRMAVGAVGAVAAVAAVGVLFGTKGTEV